MDESHVDKVKLAIKRGKTGVDVPYFKLAVGRDGLNRLGCEIYTNNLGMREFLSHIETPD